MLQLSEVSRGIKRRVLPGDEDGLPRQALQTSHTALVAGPHLEGQFTGVTGVFVVLLVLPMLLVLLWCY